VVAGRFSVLMAWLKPLARISRKDRLRINMIKLR
jgi:hypothetical protein